MCKQTIVSLLLLAGLQGAHAGLIVNVSFDDPSAAHTAYYSALNETAKATGARWGLYLSGNASLEMLISFANPGPTVTARSEIASFVTTAGGVNIFEQGAGAEIRTGLDPNGPTADILFDFNSTFVQDHLFFDPDPFTRSALVPVDKTDAYSAFLHELGHAIAFNGWRSSTDASLPAPGDYQSTFDQWVSFNGSDIFFNGPRAMAVYGGPVPITFGSNSHVGNIPPRPGASLIPDLMNGVVFFDGVQYDISALDLAIIQDTGLAIIPEPVSALLALLGLTAFLLYRRSGVPVSRQSN